GARLVLTVRALSGELRDLERVVPLGAWDDLVMTCFLEYEASTVKVHDLIWVRQPDGWRFRKGVYRKLRLAPARVTARLAAAGFAVERHEAPAGMVALVGVLGGVRARLVSAGTAGCPPAGAAPRAGRRPRGIHPLGRAPRSRPDDSRRQPARSGAAPAACRVSQWACRCR